MGGMHKAADRSDESKGLQQPDDDPYNDDRTDNLLDGAIHGNDVDEVEQQADDDERNDDADDGRTEHTEVSCIRWMQKTPQAEATEGKSFGKA
jgi:hypothetical protein